LKGTKIALATIIQKETLESDDFRNTARKISFDYILFCRLYIMYLFYLFTTTSLQQNEK